MGPSYGRTNNAQIHIQRENENMKEMEIIRDQILGQFHDDTIRLTLRENISNFAKM